MGPTSTGPGFAASVAAGAYNLCVVLDPDRFSRALEFAARSHAGQKVPGSELPYVVHVMKVAMEVVAAARDDATLDHDFAVTCALLHDTVEDAGSREQAAETARAIRTTFGPRVIGGVEALTKCEDLPKPERMLDSLRRIQEQPREVWLVKLADRITNLEPPPEYWPVSKRRGYLAEGELILQELGSASQRLRARLEQKLKAYVAHCS